MKISTLISLLIMFVILFLTSNYILFSMVKSICDESEVQPVRYELGGLFGNVKVPIPTTEGNQDGYEKVCIKTGEPNFWSISENMNYIVEKTKEVKGK